MTVSPTRQAYTGGQSCCHHLFTLLDKDQKTPWQVRVECHVECRVEPPSRAPKVAIGSRNGGGVLRCLPVAERCDNSLQLHDAFGHQSSSCTSRPLTVARRVSMSKQFERHNSMVRVVLAGPAADLQHEVAVLVLQGD